VTPQARPGEERTRSLLAVALCDRGPVEDSGSGVGRLVVITGLPGSGKTTLAVELAASVPSVRMCPDDWMTASGIDL
jgi:predicted kinase